MYAQIFRIGGFSTLLLAIPYFVLHIGSIFKTFTDYSKSGYADAAVSDPVLVGLISAVALLLANLVIGFIQYRRMRSQNSVDDASVATAYATLNKELREQMEEQGDRIKSLEQIRSGPYRVTNDISFDPDPRVIRTEIVLMSQDPIIDRPVKKEQ